MEAVGPCPRCEMLSIDQQTGLRAAKPEILLELARYRRRGGKMMFGAFLAALNRGAERDGEANWNAAPYEDGSLVAAAGSDVGVRNRCLDESEWLVAMFGTRSVLRVGQRVIAVASN